MGKGPLGVTGKVFLSQPFKHFQVGSAKGGALLVSFIIVEEVRSPDGHGVNREGSLGRKGDSGSQRHFEQGNRIGRHDHAFHNSWICNGEGQKQLFGRDLEEVLMASNYPTRT
eukprot:EC121299.1.p3 GENE.EC121299.1~~EC121299.1.p3  ORF type:complete len:113 (+),score=8.55 EC121299.1:118-456(+)